MLKTMTRTAPLDPAALLEFERQIGNRLPDDYRAFIEQYNGGQPSPSAFRIAWAGQECARRFPWADLDSLFGVGRESHRDLSVQWQCFNDRVPKDCLPIGHDPGGNIILLGISGARRGHVLFWVRDGEVEEGEEPDDRNVGSVAESFSALLGSLSDD